MKKRIPVIWIVSILMLWIIVDPASAGRSKTQDLEQKVFEISSLRAKIIDKIDQAVEMQARLERQLNGLQDEIRSEQIRVGIYSYPEAMQNLRIRYNLSLIQVLLAYVEQLHERIAYFQSGNEHLKFLVDQIKDDMALIHALKDMEIDHLTERINRVLDEFTTETKKPVFNVTAMRKMPIQHVWEQTSTRLQLN
jgi:hypothetical protein